MQERVIKAFFAEEDYGPYKIIEELWDGEL